MVVTNVVQHYLPTPEIIQPMMSVGWGLKLAKSTKTGWNAISELSCKVPEIEGCGFLKKKSTSVAGFPWSVGNTRLGSLIPGPQS